MKASRLIFTLLLASSVAVVQLAAQQTKADQKPIEEVKAKAEAGDAESEVELGRRYDKGEGVVKDHAEAAKWYRKAAEQNLRRGSIQSGRLLRPRRRRDEGSGGGGEVVSQSRRAELRQGSIQSGQSAIGTGAGVAKDPVEAAKWVRKAAEQNLANAQYSLGLCYYKGEGVTKDQAEAVKWYRKAAEQNYAKAQHNLGFCYAHGEGVAKDQVEAVKWYRKAAEQNLAEAQRTLGVCYDNGTRRGEGSGRGGEMVSQSRRAE